MDKKYPCATMGSLLLTDPQYGSNQRAIDGDPASDIRYIRITDIDIFGNLKDTEWKTAQKIEPQYILKENDLLFARKWSHGWKNIHL